MNINSEAKHLGRLEKRLINQLYLSDFLEGPEQLKFPDFKPIYVETS